MRTPPHPTRLLITVCAAFLLVLTGCPPEEDATEPEPPAPPPSEESPTPAPPPGAIDPTDEFTLLLDDDERHLFAFSRPFGEDLLVLVTNWSDEAHGLRIPKPAPGHFERIQATTDEPYRVQTDSTGIILEIGARTMLVLRRAATASGGEGSGVRGE